MRAAQAGEIYNYESNDDGSASKMGCVKGQESLLLHVGGSMDEVTRFDVRTLSALPYTRTR